MCRSEHETVLNDQEEILRINEMLEIRPQDATMTENNKRFH